MALSQRRKRNKKEAWGPPILFTILLFVAAEAVLRIIGFQYSNTPLSMRYVASIAHLGANQTAYNKSFHIDYTLDPVLLWKPLPNTPFTNSEGFIGREWSREKPRGTLRVIALGDSCTVSGENPYPRVLEEALARRNRSAHWEVLNAGVGSWSSYQGLKLLETRLLVYHPDFVTIYFGWNDHWLAWAAPDKNLSRLLEHQWRARNWINHSRLLEALLWLATKVRGGPRFTAQTPFRVSADDYEANLLQMIELVRSIGGMPVLITAPTDLTPNHPTTLSLTQQTHNFYDPAIINNVHDVYNDRVRDAAARTGVILVDAAEDFEGPGTERWFRDGIHLSADGHRKLADLLAKAISTAALRLTK